MDDLKYCKNFLLKHDREIYAIIPEFAEEDLAIALFSLNIEVALIFTTVSEKNIAEIKYQWWYEQVKSLFSQNNIVHKVPLLNLLAKVKEKYALKFADFELFFVRQKFNLGNKKLENWQEFEEFIDGSFYHLIKIIINVSNISFTSDSLLIMRKYCYVFKLIRVMNSLTSRNYNIHPFITNDLIKSLATEKAYNRNKLAIEMLKKRVEKILLDCKYIKTQNKFVDNFQLLVKFQAYDALKYIELDSQLIFSPLRFKIFKIFNFFHFYR